MEDTVKRFVVVVAALALLLPSCRKEQKPGGLTLAPPQWPEREISTYRVMLGEETAGDYIIDLSRSELPGGEALNLVGRTRVVVEDYETVDSTWLLMQYWSRRREAHRQRDRRALGAVVINLIATLFLGFLLALAVAGFYETLYRSLRHAPR